MADIMLEEVQEKIIVRDVPRRDVDGILSEYNMMGRTVIGWEHLVMGGFASLIIYLGA